MLTDLDIRYGAGFGSAGEGYVRFSAFNSRANVEEAMRRVVKAL